MPRASKPRMTIIRDSREQLGWSFNGEGDSFDVVRAALPAGDYSLAGYENRIAIERKSLEDFCGTVIRCRGRFEDELEKLRNYEFAAVIVEASLEDVEQHRYRMAVHPNALLGSAVAIHMDYGVPVLFAGGREQARNYTHRLLARFFERAKRRERELPQPSQGGKQGGKASREMEVD